MNQVQLHRLTHVYHLHVASILSVKLTMTFHLVLAYQISLALHQIAIPNVRFMLIVQVIKHAVEVDVLTRVPAHVD